MNHVELRRLDLPLNVTEPMVTDLIANGGILSSEILRQWSAHVIWTAADREVTSDELANLTHGGLRAPSRLNPFITSFIRQFLDGDRRSLAIFEDAVTRAGDAVLKRAKSPYLLIDDGVLPFLAGKGHDDADVSALLMEAWSWRLVGVLTQSVVMPINQPTQADLAGLVKGAKHVIVGAWDGEGILVVDR